MTTTATVHTSDVQASGRQLVVFEFTHLESGTTWLSGTHRLASDAIPLVVGASLTAVAEAAQTQAELDSWAYLFFAGFDLDTLDAPLFNTLNSVRKHVLRELLNFMRADVPDDGKAQIATNVLPYLGKYTNGQIANVIDNANWTAAKVGAARTKLQTIADALTDLDHGEGEV